MAVGYNPRGGGGGRIRPRFRGHIHHTVLSELWSQNSYAGENHSRRLYVACDIFFEIEHCSISFRVAYDLNSKKVSIIWLLERVHSETKVSYDFVIYYKSFINVHFVNGYGAVCRTSIVLKGNIGRQIPNMKYDYRIRSIKCNVSENEILLSYWSSFTANVSRLRAIT